MCSELKQNMWSSCSLTNKTSKKCDMRLFSTSLSRYLHIHLLQLLQVFTVSLYQISSLRSDAFAEQLNVQ